MSYQISPVSLRFNHQTPAVAKARFGNSESAEAAPTEGAAKKSWLPSAQTLKTTGLWAGAVALLGGALTGTGYVLDHFGLLPGGFHMPGMTPSPEGGEVPAAEPEVSGPAGGGGDYVVNSNPTAEKITKMPVSIN